MPESDEHEVLYPEIVNENEAGRKRKAGIAGIGIGLLLQLAGWLGGIGIHFAASYIAFQRHGFLWAFVAFLFPLLSTIWALWATVRTGVWWFAILVGVYVGILISSRLLLIFGIRSLRE